ncbi:hypothetical protein ACFWY6_38330 [Streptomyces sp. NPDC059037]|uniref:hypothetical protein n=1 Tax=Streptomyces sp. NPDC059037 TaxID=3346710 RepID=UPI00368140A8
MQVDAEAGVLVPADDGKRGVQCPVCQDVAFRHERWNRDDQFGTDPWIPEVVPPGCAPTVPVRILALNRPCWKCGETATCVVGLYPVRPSRTDCWVRSVDETSRVWVKDMLQAAGLTQLASSIKPRWSSTMRSRYLSSGCWNCDALQGDFPVDEEASDRVREGGVEALETVLVAEVPTLLWQRTVLGERGDGAGVLM